MSDLIVLNAEEVGSTEPTETTEKIIKDMRIKITTLKGLFQLNRTRYCFATN